MQKQRAAFRRPLFAIQESQILVSEIEFSPMTLKALVAQLRISINQLDSDSMSLESATDQLAALLGKAERKLQQSPQCEPSLEYYKVFRSYIEHEDALINNRLTWATAIQAVLFGIQTFADKAARLEYVQHIPLLGIFVAFASWTGVAAAVLAIRKLNRVWELIKKSSSIHNSLPKLIGGGSTLAHGLGLVAPTLYPVGIGIAWGRLAFPGSFPCIIIVGMILLLVPIVFHR